MLKKDELYVIESCGKRRRAVKAICQQCNEEFLHRKGLYNKFCGKDCRDWSRRHRIIVECAWCKKDVEKKVSQLYNSKSRLYFCDRKCKDEAQRIGGIKEIMPPHYGTAPEKYRLLFTDEELVCKRCGYNEFLSCVDVHHIDKNRDNNCKETNLIALCSNCHRSLHFGFWKIKEI